MIGYPVPRHARRGPNRQRGQWLLSAFPGYFFASPTDNDVLFVAIGFGLRTF